MKDLQENKASPPPPGTDGIIPKILKLCADEIALALTCIFNKGMRMGELPKDWSAENVSPIFKT